MANQQTQEAKPSDEGYCSAPDDPAKRAMQPNEMPSQSRAISRSFAGRFAIVRFGVLALWGACLFWFEPDVYLLFQKQTEFIPQIAFLCLTLLLNLFWLAALYYLSVGVFTLAGLFKKSRPIVQERSALSKAPTVATAAGGEGPPESVRGKSALMHVSCLTLWMMCLICFDPDIWLFFQMQTGLFARIAVFMFMILLNLFWLAGCYYVVLGAFALLARSSAMPTSSPAEDAPVAVLYTTKDDFQELAALSCVTQNHPNFHVFMLDDSLGETTQKRVDAFAARHAGKATVVRRPDRTGFKAGNVNHALRHTVRDYTYFAVIDADNVLPADFLTELHRLFVLSPSIGFVQANHLPNPWQKSSFAKDLCLQILVVWTLFFRPKNQFGFVPFLGHGGMIRYDAWKAVGGFPEIVSEDLAFSTRLAQIGLRGYFASHVVAYEDYPESYGRFRQQQKRYILGMCQFLHQEIGSFLRSAHVRWFEKLDVMLACGTLLLPVLFLMFLLLFCACMPWLFSVQKLMTVEMFNHELLTIPVLATRFEILRIGTWDRFALTAVGTFAPTLGALVAAWRYPWRGLRMVVLSTGPFLSLLVMATLAVLSYVFVRKAEFHATGGGGQRNLDWSKAATGALEGVLGAALSIMCLLTFNLCLLGFALSLFLSPILQVSSWDSPWLRPLLYVPFGLIVGGLLLGGLELLTSQGLLTTLFYCRF